MNGNRALRVLAYMSISIGIGVLSRPAWGFIIFGILLLIDNFIVKSPPPAPARVDAEKELTEQ
jgi:hypothetical protein